jgi:hypothetical protein
MQKVITLMYIFEISMSRNCSRNNPTNEPSAGDIQARATGLTVSLMTLLLVTITPP